MAGASLTPIFNRLTAAPRYHPMSANTFADWSMEAGDVIRIKRDGTEYDSPVFSSTLKWHGKHEMDINTEGDKDRPPVSKMSQRKYASARSGGGGYYGQQELFYEMESEDGLLHATISATAERLQTDYEQRIEGTEDTLSSQILQTAAEIRTRIDNEAEHLGSRIDQVDRSVSLSVGRLKYERIRTVPKLPKTGESGALYKVTSTGKYYVWTGTGYAPASADLASGEANYIKAGEIVIALNETTGQTEAKLDADVVYVGRGAETLKDLNLPDWMDTTSGLVAQKATIVELNALKARFDSIDADFIGALLVNSSVLSTKYLYSKTLACEKFYQGEHEMNLRYAVNGIQLVRNGNTYTLNQRRYINLGKWEKVGDFSRAVDKATWTWVGGAAKVKLEPQNQTFTSRAIDAINTPSSKDWDDDYKGFNIRLTVDDTAGTTVFSDTLHFDTTASYDAGGGGGGGTHNIDIPSTQIYTTDGSPVGTDLSTMKTRVLQAIADSESLCFRVDCGGTTKWYHMTF